MPHAIRSPLMACAIGLMLAACADPASLPNEIQAADDVGNTNMPAVQDRGLRSVGNIVLSAVSKPAATPTPQPAPTARPTAAPTPSATPSSPILLP